MGEGSKGGQTGLISGLSEGVLEDGGSRKSLVGSRRESSKRGRIGDQKPTVVQEWQRKGYCQAILTQIGQNSYCVSLLSG